MARRKIVDYPADIFEGALDLSDLVIKRSGAGVTGAGVTTVPDRLKELDKLDELAKAMSGADTAVPMAETFPGLIKDGFLLDLENAGFSYRIDGITFQILQEDTEDMREETIAHLTCLRFDLPIAPGRPVKIHGPVMSGSLGMPITLKVNDNQWRRRFIPINRHAAPLLDYQRSLYERYLAKLERVADRAAVQLRAADTPKNIDENEEVGSW